MTTASPAEMCVTNAKDRYYDPTTAEFTTPDPLFALTGSRYGYAGNDPINGTDPTGLWCPLGHNSNGGCRGAGVAADAVSYGASWVPDCVAIGNSNCTSLGNSHKTVRDGLYLTLAASATVASGGLALDAAGVVDLGLEGGTMYAEGAAATGAGLGAAAGDRGRCGDGDEAACIAMWSGVAAASLGGLGMVPGDVGIGLAWLGLTPAGVGLGLDGLAFAEEAIRGLRCY